MSLKDMQHRRQIQNFFSLSFAEIKSVSMCNPLRGKEAADSMRDTFAKVNLMVAQEEITEDDVNRLVRELR